MRPCFTTTIPHSSGGCVWGERDQILLEDRPVKANITIISKPTSQRHVPGKPTGVWTLGCEAAHKNLQFLYVGYGGDWSFRAPDPIASFLSPAPSPTPHLQPHPQLTPVLALDKKLLVQVSDQLGRFWGTNMRALP